MSTVAVKVGPRHTALIDQRDKKLIERYVWRPVHKPTGRVYAVTSIGRRTVYMHRLLAATPPGMETDHINGNGLDNRRANLRHATASQNRVNSGKPRRPDGQPASSRFKGVTWDRARGRWRAKLRHLGCTRNLGRFTSEAAAARAYDAAARLLWGEFARLNFPDEVTA